MGLAAAYDTYGPLPFRSPGRREAANVAGLIELAAALRREPAARTTVVTFLDANRQDGLGQLAFTFARAGYRPDAPQGFTALLAEREAERAWLEATLEALADPVALIRGEIGRAHV